ncbi:patatin-like phospholipase family protein [Oceanibaculum nanhaiense]|uniref:patatin-like phospholipase family protein n=1 Tax=Oceanibaculum nanhaiense TaxID=1909734 RepID=UPI00396D2F8B
MPQAIILSLLSLVFISLSGCSSLPRHHAVPAAMSASATLPGLGEVRYVVDDPADMARLSRDVADTWVRERRWLKSQGIPTQNLPPSNLLALSGGGDKGAFGAGLLNGWSASGERPEFLLVTGVSTGALIAPFAFLGPAYDSRLKALYTEIRRNDIVQLRGVLAALTSDALADTAPLRELLRKHVDRAMLDAIAREYDKGRELWISTANLDARRRVIWNMTRIAASGHPRAVELFHDVMIASAAIPGAFPPVLIEVEVEGRTYHEMHVDGGAMSQVFVYPPSLDLAELSAEKGGERQRRLFVVMNARLDPEWAETERKVLSIAGRAITSMIHTQGVGDLYRIYLTAERDGVDFNLAYIPAEFSAPHREEFDSAFMRALYDEGYRRAAEGYPWVKRPPGFIEHHSTGAARK